MLPQKTQPPGFSVLGSMYEGRLMQQVRSGGKTILGGKQMAAGDRAQID